MAVFNDTTNKNGLIQIFEFWTRLPDGTVGADLTTVLGRQIVSRMNGGLEKIMPLLLSYSDFMRWDDPNHTDAPIGTIDIISGQPDYKLSEDDNSLDILNITNVRVFPSATATLYNDLQRMKADDPRVPDVTSPNTNNSGSPSHFLELGSRLYLFPEPNYASTNGIKIYFGREHDYFTTSDTTQEPGIPKPFHELVALYAAIDYISVVRPEDGNTLGLIQARINKTERDLKNFINLRHPTVLQIKPKRIKFR